MVITQCLGCSVWPASSHLGTVRGCAQGRLSDSWIVKWSGSGSKKAHGTVIEMQSISRVFGLIIAGLLLLKESRTGVYSQFIVSGGKGGVGRGE